VVLRASGIPTAVTPGRVHLIHSVTPPRRGKVATPLDLEPRLRCRECDTRGKAVVSIKWAALKRSI
jgi:hypothetical protein